MWTKIILAGTFQGNVLATPIGSIAASWASTRSCPPMSAAWGGGTSSLCVLWLVIVESIRFPLIMRETCCSLFTLLGLVCARVWNLLLVCNKWTDSTCVDKAGNFSLGYAGKKKWASTGAVGCVGASAGCSLPSAPFSSFGCQIDCLTRCQKDFFDTNLKTNFITRLETARRIF